MTYTFHLKKVEVPLFGVVEVDNTEKWLLAFSSVNTSTPVGLNDAAFTMIADELGMDAVGLAYSANRYVKGQFLPGTAGLGGSTLGDLGELLTFVVRKASGEKIVRVVSGTREGFQKGAENCFPQPDYIVEQSGAQFAALEVKSTQALDHQDLSGPHEWRLLQPCSTVKECRVAALPQLGLMNGEMQKQSHSLRLRDGKTVPFPVGKGIVVAVSAVDGRVNKLRSDLRLKTPKACRDAERDCWKCLPDSGCDFVMTTMPNAPGMLSLAGALPENLGQAWMVAYQRWAEAVRARDRYAAAVMTKRLSLEVDKWITAMGLAEVDVVPLRDFWKLHLSSALRNRGIGDELGEANEVGVIDADRISDDEPTDHEAVVMEQISSALARIKRDVRSSVQWFSTEPMQGHRATFTLTQDAHSTELRMMSAHWWASDDSERGEGDSRSSFAYLLTMATGTNFQVADHSLLPVKRVTASVGNTEIQLGWCWDASSQGRRNAWKILSQLGLRWFGKRPAWLVRMIYGDPRVTLHLTDNGRAVLRIENSVFD